MPQPTPRITKPIAGFLFDFDGTLAPNLDLPDMRRQVIELTQSYQVPDAVWANEYIVEIIDKACAYLAGEDAAQSQRYYRAGHTLITDIEMRSAQETRPFADCLASLTQLRRDGFGLAVVTRNCEAAVRLTFSDIDRYVDGLFARDNVTRVKPHPQHFLDAAAHLNCAPNQCVVVSDGQMDMRLAVELGMRAWGVTTGSSNRIQLEAAGAEQVFPSLQALTMQGRNRLGSRR